MPLGIGERVRG
uniref:Uncharacterized protein n=1 Tax=Arundo donax TaxID=35708 RepID=A0A0A9GZ17_ARUDO